MRYRVDNIICEVEGPQSNISTEKTGSVTVQEVLSADLKSVKKTMLANEQLKATNVGELPMVAGLYYDNAKPKIECYLEGARSVASHSGSVAETAMVKMFASVAQQAPKALIRSKVSSAPSATEMVEDLAQAHYASANGSKTRIAVFPVQFDGDDGHIEVVAGTYATASNTISLLTELSATPSSDDPILFAYNEQFVENWSATPYAITIRALGNETLQNKKAIGCVGQCSIPAVGPNEIPKVSFDFSAASGSYNFADTRPSASPVKPKTYAGSSIGLGMYGLTALTEVCGRIDVSLGSQFVPETCEGSAIGIQNWLRSEGACELKLTVPGSLNPDDLGFSETSWTELMENEGPSYFHLMATWGQRKAGSIFAVYFPKLVVTAVEEGDENKYSITTISLKAAVDETVPAWIACQA